MAHKVTGTTVIDDNYNITLDNLTINQAVRINTFLGETYGYWCVVNITRFPFANETDIVTLGTNIFTPYAPAVIHNEGGASSTTHGYLAGGATSPGPQNVIQRFPFASDSDNCSDVGDLVYPITDTAGHSDPDQGYGYTTGGYVVPPLPYGDVNYIQRWSFSSPATNASDVGNLVISSDEHGAISSATYGYTAGGASGVPLSAGHNYIQRFLFNTGTTNASDVGDMTYSARRVGGTSSQDYGYSLGGWNPAVPAYYDNIERWPFAASSTNASDVGNLTKTVPETVGWGSYVYGWCSGGSPFYGLNKWPFAAGSVNASSAATSGFDTIRNNPGIQI